MFSICDGFSNRLESVALHSDSNSECHSVLSKEGNLATLHRHSIWVVRIVSFGESSGSRTCSYNFFDGGQDHRILGDNIRIDKTLEGKFQQDDWVTAQSF